MRARSKDMDEMTLLEDFRAVVAPPDEMTLTRARERMLGGGAPGRGRLGQLRPHRPGTRGKLALTGLAGLTVATAAAVAVAVIGSGGGASFSGTASPVVKEMAYR